MTRASWIPAFGQDLSFCFGSVGQASRGNGDVEEAALDLQRVLGKALSGVARGPTNALPRRIKNSVVAGAEEPVVLGLPPHLTAQMRTGTGEGDKISIPPIPSLSGDVDGLS